jgi:hypothetical protein
VARSGGASGESPADRAETRLARSEFLCIIRNLSAHEIIEQIKALPPHERAEVTRFVVENDDSWIPESLKEGMADADAGRFVDMETVLSGAKPPARRKRE